MAITTVHLKDIDSKSVCGFNYRSMYPINHTEIVNFINSFNLTKIFRRTLTCSSNQLRLRFWIVREGMVGKSV